MPSEVDFEWNLISPIEGKSICEVVGAKKVIEYPDILNEIVNYALNMKSEDSSWLMDYSDEESLRKLYQDAWYCTDCKLFGILFPGECAISITQGDICKIDEILLVADLAETNGAHLIEECMKDRSPEEMLELASLLKDHVQGARERFNGDKDVEWFISDLEDVINWLIALANYGFSINTTIIGG